MRQIPKQRLLAIPVGWDVFSKRAPTSTAFQSFISVGVGERVSVQGLIDMANKILCRPYYVTFLAYMHVRYEHSRCVLKLPVDDATLDSQVITLLTA